VAEVAEMMKEHEATKVETKEKDKGDAGED